MNIYDESAERGAKFFDAIKGSFADMPKYDLLKIKNAIQAAFMDEAFQGRKALLDEDNSRLKKEIATLKAKVAK